MNIQHLYYFQSLARHEHYITASEEQLTSPSSISYAIDSIEKEIGLPLFKKSGRNISLTKYGRIFLSYTNDIINSYEKGISEMKDLKENIESSSKIGSLFTMSFDFLPILLSKFNDSRKEKTVFQLSLMDTAEMAEKMKSGEIFMGFALRVEDPEIISYPLFKEEFVLIAPKGKYDITSPIKDLSIFNNENFITYDKKFIMYKSINKIFESYNFKPNFLYHVSSDVMLAEFVSKGLGLAITPNSLKLSQYDVDIFHLKIQKFRTLCLLWSKNATLNSADKKLKKYILDNYLEIAESNDEY